jgi:ParB-like chromosome segregation protein Spo0J
MSNAITQIENKPGTVGAGDFVMATGVGGRAIAAPNNVIRIAVDLIRAEERLRKINRETVDRLYNDIMQQGLLQPIGVRQSRDGVGYVVIYGLHRLLAFKRGWELAQKLIAERTDKDPEAYAMARRWQSIPAVVHDMGIPLDYAVLKEISENLIRSELSKEERAVHETKYTHLVKKLGLVASADEKRAANAKNQHPMKKEGLGQIVPHPPKQTATEKVTADLGIDRKQLSRSHQKVNALAKAVARDKKLPPPLKITAETAATEEAAHTIRLAELGANDKRKAEKEGKSTVKVHPIAPSPEEIVTVRIDVTDPKQLLKWLKERLTSASKPMSMQYLRELHAGLGELIAGAEKEA